MDQSFTHLPYRLLALDIDGTVVGRDLEVPAATSEAIAEYQAAGGHVTLATGRTFRTTMPFVEHLGIDAPVICYQGALIRDPGSKRVLFHEPVPPELAVEAAARLLAAGIYVQAYVDDELVVPYEGDETRLYRSFSPVHLPVHVVADLPAFLAEQPPTKLLFIAHEGEVGPRIAGLKTHFADRLNIARSHAFFGELTAPGCTKGRALATLAQMLGLPREAVAAAGDQENDVSMVEWAGFGMAVRSGPPALHAVADVLIDGPEEAGLAAGIRRYLLGTSDI
jgi:Cof subfamily protein (haloacid dehalogenase superfamily)